MRNRQPVRRLLYPVFLLALAPGCHAFQAYRPVVIQARDAETQKPIPGAEVRIWYPPTRPGATPGESRGAAGEDGIARLEATPHGESGVILEASAPGYLYEPKEVPVAAVRALEPSHLFEAVDRRPVNFVLDLYAEPRPSIELVVPTGYRGVIKVVVEAQEDAPCQPGQREFSYPVTAAGTVQVTGPGVLRFALPWDFHARYADGTPLPRDAKGTACGFWWLKCEAECHHFLVGTASEYHELGGVPTQSTAPRRPAGGGTGKGRGRHGH